MSPETVDLSRLQFGLTIMFHYLFPPLSIGLGALLVFMEGMYLKTKDPQYEAMARFWTKIFAVNFALGTASGIVMEFQFGTNWSVYSRFVGDVFGSALAAEGIFAFFLESGFLAVLVFGWDKVSAKMHFFSTLMVSLGTIFSAVWIVVANSWQQTPAGFHIVGEGLTRRAEITSFWAVVFSPSSMHRLGHVLLGAFIMGAFFVMSVTAYYILKNRHLDFAKKGFRIALFFGLVTAVLILGSGDAQARKVAETQPPKMAAFEGVFKTEPGTPLYVFGLPDSKTEQVNYGLKIPGMLSFLVHHDFKTPVAGLDQVPANERPPVEAVFQTYHIMVGLGMFFIALTAGGVFLLWRGTLWQARWFLWLCVFSVIGPVLANELGWVAAEVGRQPWIVYKLLKTQDAASKVLAPDQVLGSIIVFALIYTLLLFIWFYVVDHKIKQGPEEHPPHLPEKTTLGGLTASAAELASPSGPSLTDARDEKE